MFYEFAVRRDNGKITGIFSAIEKVKIYPWSKKELTGPDMWIISKVLADDVAAAIKLFRYKAVGDPRGQIKDNIYNDIDIEELPETEWPDYEGE